MRPRAPSRAAHAVAVLLLAGAALGACMPSADTEGEPVEGQGDLASEDRTAGEITHVSVGSGMTVAILTGSPTRVTLTAQANLLPLITTETVDGQLVVNVPSPGITSTQPITLTVVAPDIESVALSDGAYGAMDTARPAVKLDVSGGATIEASGETAALDLTASSGGQALLKGLVAERATVDVSGGSRSELKVVQALAGRASSGATIELAGKPATVNVETSGGGMVIGD